MDWSWKWAAALGNSALILPLLACTLALLAAQSPDGRRDARRWLLASALAFGAMALSKIAFYGWGIGIHPLRLASPSGHATLAMAFWPVFLALLVPKAAPHPPCGHLLPASGEKETALRTEPSASESPSPRLRGEGPLRAAKQGEGPSPHWRTAAIAAGFALGALCSISRVATHAHTLSETIVGAAAGALVALVTLHGLRTQRLPLARTAVVGALLLCALVAWSSQRPLRLPTERWLARAGAHLAGRDAPVSKRHWLRTGEVVDQPRRRQP